MAIFRKKARLAGRKRATADKPAKAFSYTTTPGGQQANRQRGAAQKKSAAASLRRFWLQRFGLIILFSAAIVCVVSVLSLTPHAKLLPLNSADKDLFLRDQATYQTAADKLLADSLWNRNKITVDTASFNKQMTRQFPELSGVSVALPLLGHRPVVYLQPAQPALVLAADNGSFVIDERGKALLPADGSAAQGKLPQVVDQSGLRVKLNQQALTADDVDFIRTVVGQLAVRQITVSSLVLPAGTNELDARLAGQTYFVKFNMHDDSARQQAGTYLATIAQLKRKNTPPAQYIDVRVPGRAYYQ